MICFEEFDPNTNYPVVLPCGHTYVCVTCANKIDICMECRTPLVMKIEVPPPPPPPNTPQLEAASGGQQRRGSGAASPSLTTTTSSGNEYADRVQNSPGFRRRYGHREEYNKRSGTRVNMPGANAQQKKPEPIKTRLPLPKNAVLLSLIQASEPHRRRAEVEAPPTPVKTQEEKSLLNLTAAGSSGESSPIAARSGGLHTNSNSTGSLPKFSRPSPLFLDGSASGEGHHTNNDEALQGSSADGEEHKIRVGTYLEGGPCGTYAVAVKSGLLGEFLVYCYV